MFLFTAVRHTYSLLLPYCPVAAAHLSCDFAFTPSCMSPAGCLAARPPLLRTMRFHTLVACCSSAAVALQVDAGVADQLVLGDPTAPRFVYWDKKLRPTPSGLDAITFDLMSLVGKIRAGLGVIGIKEPLPGGCGRAQGAHVPRAPRLAAGSAALRCSAAPTRIVHAPGQLDACLLHLPALVSNPRAGSRRHVLRCLLELVACALPQTCLTLPFALPYPCWLLAAAEYEESVEQYVRRNLGAEVFERLIEPFCSGVYAGDPAKLSMKAAFGKVWRWRAEGRPGGGRAGLGYAHGGVHRVHRGHLPL